MTKHSTKHAKRTRSRIRVPGDDGRGNLRQNSQQDRKSETLRTNNKQIPTTGDRMNQEQGKRNQIRNRTPHEVLRLLQPGDTIRSNRRNGKQRVRGHIRGLDRNDRSTREQPTRESQKYNGKTQTAGNNKERGNNSNATAQQTDGRRVKNATHVRHSRLIRNRENLITSTDHVERR